MGSWTISESTFEIERGNLLEQKLDAICLDVNRDWMPEGPSSKAILGAVDVEFLDSLRSRNSAKPASVEIKPSQALPCDFIILCTMDHRTEIGQPDPFLQDCFENVFLKADRHDDIKTLGTAPLGLDDFDFPIDSVSKAGIKTAKQHLQGDTSLDQIRFVVFDSIQYNSIDNFGEKLLEHGGRDSGRETRLHDYY